MLLSHNMAKKGNRKKYQDQVEFWHTSLMNLDYDKLVAKINQLETLIYNMTEKKKLQVLEAIQIMSDQIKVELKRYSLIIRHFYLVIIRNM